jgi:methylenetetrahydrofolate reductase (NADPH)
MSFQKRLFSGEFVVLAEMNTPKGVDTSQLLSQARRLKGRIDAVTVPDMDNGIMRMSALAGGVLLNQQGIEPIIHVYCRDRNRMALQGDVLAAYSLGIQNLIVVGSEDIAYCDHQDMKTVNDLDELGLIGAIRSLEQGSIASEWLGTDQQKSLKSRNLHSPTSISSSPYVQSKGSSGGAVFG